MSISSSESVRLHAFFNTNADNVSLVVVSTGDTCKVVFDHAFKGGPVDRAGVVAQVVQKHCLAHVDYASWFVGKRGLAVTVDGVSYKVASAETLQSTGMVSIWLV